MKEDNFPQIMHWHITGTCQLKCNFCYAIPGRDVLNEENCKKIITNIVNSGIRIVVFTGGEPLQPLLLKDNFLIRVLELCKQQLLYTALDTNAIELAKEGDKLGG